MQRDKKSPPPYRKKRSSNILVYTAVLLVAVISGTIFIFLNWDNITSSSNESSPVMVRHEKTVPADSPSQTPQIAETDSGQTQSNQDTAPEEDSPQSTAPDQQKPLQQEELTAGGEELTPDPDMHKCTQSAKEVRAFYKHLDASPYIQSYKLKASSEEYFTKLIEKLLVKPPVVSRETDDLFTILKNTAHFFRVLGKDNIVILKGILTEEQGLVEDILIHFYALINNPACPDSQALLSDNKSGFYEYAGFFLNTMGGRLYLFRRDSKSRMVVSYYALLIVDQANEAENNSHGLEMQPSLDLLINEIENGGDHLKHKQLYLETLYYLQEKYQQEE